MALLRALESLGSTGMDICSGTHGDGFVYLQCLSMVHIPAATVIYSKE